MHNFKTLLTRKVGPLPAVAWVLVLVGGIMVARYLRSKSASAAPAATATDSVDTTSDPGSVNSGTDSGTTGILDDQVKGLQNDVGLLYDLYGSGDGAYAADTGFAAGDTGASSAAPTTSAAVAAPVAPTPTVVKPDATPAPAPAPITGSYNPNSGVYTTPEGVKIAPTVDYSTDPAAPLLGPSIFAFKGAGAYSAPSPAINPTPGKNIAS